MVDIIMPQLGETVTEGTVTRWTKAVGDEVGEDEVLFEVSTDKVDSEVRSPAKGYLAEILVPEGQTVDVGVRLAVIATDPAGREGANGTAQPGTDQPGTARPGTDQPGTARPGTDQPGTARPGTDQSGTARPGTDQSGTDQSGTDPARPAPHAAEHRARSDPWARNESDDAPPEPAGGSGAEGPRVLSPVVRRLLSEHGLDAAEVPGTGAGGRITRADVLARVDARRAQPHAAPAHAVTEVSRPAGVGEGRPADGLQPPAGEGGRPRYGAPAEYSPPAAAATSLVRPTPSPVPAFAPGARDEVIPFSNIRRRTAEHMVRSQATSAHTLVVMEVDFEAVEAARRTHRDRFLAEEGIKLTYLPFIARALADAISAFPHLNASVGDDCLVIHHDLHLGIAVDLGEEGLIVPVIHEAGDKRLRAIARESAELARRARQRKLSADDISGGTFTITNPGPFGTFVTAPIINQPQVAILSTDGVKRRPVVVTMPDGTEGIAIHSTGMLALSFDHRALDGAYASRFLGRVRQILQGRDWALEL